jgi:hypothetical protein
MPLNLIQRLFTREVIGTVIGIEHVRNFVSETPITIYEIQCDDGSINSGAMLGHLESPSKGDYVQMYMSKWLSGWQLIKPVQKILKDGSTKIAKEVVYYEPISNYKILQKNPDSKTK